MIAFCLCKALKKCPRVEIVFLPLSAFFVRSWSIFSWQGVDEESVKLTGLHNIQETFPRGDARSTDVV